MLGVNCGCHLFTRKPVLAPKQHTFKGIRTTPFHGDLHHEWRGHTIYQGGFQRQHCGTRKFAFYESFRENIFSSLCRSLSRQKSEGPMFTTGAPPIIETNDWQHHINFREESDSFAKAQQTGTASSVLWSCWAFFVASSR